MRDVTISLHEILSIVTCADDYGHGNEVLLDAMAKWSGWVSDEEIDRHSQYYVSEDGRTAGYTEEDHKECKQRLTDWRDRYCKRFKEKRP